MIDVGLLHRHAHLASSAYTEGNGLIEEFKGALTENYVLQSLYNIPDMLIHYWSETPYEVDYVMQIDYDTIYDMRSDSCFSVLSPKHSDTRLSIEKLKNNKTGVCSGLISRG